MLKLVSQFDNVKSRVSVATPTCGGCCCCCCCLISTVATASISARAFGSMVEKTEPQAVEKIKAARLSGFWQPIGLLVIVLGAFAITISLTTYQNQFLNILIPVALGLAYLTITTIFLVKRVKNALAIGAAILFSLALGALVSTEVAIAGFSIAGGLGIVYLIGAPILVVVLSKWAFSNKPDLVETAVEDTEPTIA